MRTLVLVIVMLAGCDHAWRVHGFVMPASRVILECPGRTAVKLEVSETGRFAIVSTGDSVALTCIVRVIDPNGIATAYPVYDNCREYYRDGCARVALNQTYDLLLTGVISTIGDDGKVVWVLFTTHAAGFRFSMLAPGYARIRERLEAANRRREQVTVLARGVEIIDVE